MTDQETEVQVPDRRETIEAAFEAAESPAAAPAPVAAPAPASESLPTEAGTNETSTKEAKPASEATPADSTPASPASDAKTGDVERPPQAWKAPLKAKWDKLDPDIRQEVTRRERETTQVLNETAQARQLQQAFVQAIQPYQARLSQLGAHPIQAMGQLLKADQFLSSAPAAARAQYMATLIKGYGVDIRELDAALAGQPAADPVSAKVEQLLQQRLAPFQTFMQQQSAAQRQAQAAQEHAASMTVEQMAQDTVKYPYFDQVRSTMADLVEFSASKGQTLTIEAAYNRAIALDPTVSAEIATRTASQTAATQVTEQTARARRALNASASISGNPGGAARSSPNASDRRATIEAAFGAAEGR